MNILTKDNYFIIKLTDDDISKKIFVNRGSLVGTVNSGIKEYYKNEKGTPTQYKYSRLIFTENFEDESTIIVEGNNNNVIQFPLESGHKYYVSSKTLLGMIGDVHILRKEKKFYNKNTQQDLFLIEGTGELLLNSTNSKILQFNMDNKENNFSTNKIMLFDASLSYKIYKKTKNSSSISFNGEGIVYFGL